MSDLGGKPVALNGARSGYPVLLWFRRDLRLSDNPAIDAAVALGQPIIPVYISDDADAGAWSPGGASRWWLHGSLSSLSSTIEARGNRLILKTGAADAVINSLLSETGAKSVYWNRRYEPWATKRDKELKTALQSKGIEARSFNTGLIREPWTVTTQKGEPYKVFTPFWKALRALGEPDEAKPAPSRIPAPADFPQSEELNSWGLLPTAPDWAGGLRGAWTPGEDAAHSRLNDFTDGSVFDYQDKRNLPGISGTSQLSPHLHFGEIGPRQVWYAVVASALARTGSPMPRGVETYLSEIAWREFCYHLLFHFPDLPTKPLRTEFSGFDWQNNADDLSAWQRGSTGYPIVDAGMRELWATGWMHNRVRMIVASFLIKDLLIDWRIGEEWFWDTLVDADLASNSASWQWVAGCGADAAPYFRVFNPTIQGTKFDPDGRYVRKWVPELAKLPDRLIHAPWTAKPIELADAGVELGRDYPMPIVDHSMARNRALERYKQLKAHQDGR
ncbi:MAG: deoxyribodipyrimidine photo-lyase [Alphaproteobacteria bacterium]|nr:deoxyribodipyrimidine photo-lyase [Alphaproteobacteria bacterium]